jgi:hypothetical protein
MAKLDVKATFSAPEEINIPLVRGDVADQASVYRICFEVGLSLFSALVGVILGIDKVERIHWVPLFVCGVAALTFLGLNVRLMRQARGGL